MGQRKLYLDDIPLQTALDRLSAALRAAGLDGPLSLERVPLSAALGRVTAEPILARLSSPHYHAAAMDGYALRSVDADGASDRRPIDLVIGEGAAWVDTGDPMPGSADAVVPVEVVEPIGEQDDLGRALHTIRLRQGVTPWQHVRAMGEDYVETELVLPSGHRLRPEDIGALANVGLADVPVVRRPRVAILPTGDELVPPGSDPAPGQIPESNSLVLAAQVQAWGGVATRLGPVGDEVGSLRAAVEAAMEDHDLILMLSGSSAGAEDLTALVVETIGDLLVHGVAVRPGHPVVMGMLAATQADRAPTPVIGVPGYPVSAALTGEIFLRPLLERWLGRPPTGPAVLQAEMAQKTRSSAGDDEYLRVAIGRIDGRWVAQPLSRGAGIMRSLVDADGILVAPAGVQGYQAGDLVTVRLRRPVEALERAILVQGSHDLMLDLIKQELWGDGIQLTSVNLGSLGGLMALDRGVAHVAGSHLLDPESGEFNVSYVRRYVADRSVILINLAWREQGLIVAAGNPDGLAGLEDLERPQLRFVNRQRGSGTRVLLDHNLDQLGLDPASIHGYQHEVYTHLALAAEVAAGRADCGLGLRAAARALDLDFLPVARERYDLVIPVEGYRGDRLAPLLSLLVDKRFHAKISATPGYDSTQTGQVMAEIDAA